MGFAAAQPVNYAGIMAQGQGLAFNPMEAELNNARINLAQTAAQGQQIQNAAAVQALNLQQLELKRRMAFGSDMQSFVQNPSAQGLAALVGNYPEFAQDAENAWGTLDTAERRSTATALGSVASLAAKGDYDGAANLVQSYITSAQQSGRDTSQAQQMLQMLKSGDPAQQRAVIGLASIYAGGAVGFDKAADFLKGIGLNQTPVTLNEPGGGQSLYSFNPVDGSINNGSTGGTGAAPAANGPGTGAAPTIPTTLAPSSAPTTLSGGSVTPQAQAAINSVLGHEGGWNPKDMNGAPTMMGINLKANPLKVLAQYGVTNPKQMTPSQASSIYYDRYWLPSGAENLPQNMQAPYLDVYVRNPALAKKALAQSGGDPAKFMQIASGSFANMAANNPKAAPYAKAWAARDADNTAMATGAAPAGGAAATPASTAPQGTNGALVSTGAGALNTQGAEPGHAWNPQHTAEIPVPGSDVDPASYQSEIDPAARMWLLTGQFPMGSGGTGGGGQITIGEKNAITKYAMQLWQNAGHSSNELTALRSKYAGLNTSLQNATQTASALTAAQEGLEKDANLVLTAQRALARQAPNNPNGMGIVSDNAPAGGLISATFRNRQMLDWYATHGDPQQQAAVKTYRDAVNAYAASYTKFMTAANGVGGSAQPSDSAREISDELNDEGLGPTALRAHLQTVIAEANNKRMGWLQQAAALHQQMSSLLPGAPVPGGQAPQGHGAVVRTGVDRNTGRRVVQYSDGTIAYGG